MDSFDWELWARQVLSLLDSPEVIVCLPEVERFKLSCLFDDAREALLRPGCSRSSPNAEAQH